MSPGQNDIYQAVESQSFEPPGEKKVFFSNYKYSWFKSNRHFRNDKGTGAKQVPQLFLGSHRSAIGQFFSLSIPTVP